MRTALLAVLLLMLSAGARAGDYSLEIDDNAPASDALAQLATARTVDVIHALEAYFRGEAAPSGESYGNLIASLLNHRVRYHTAASRKAVDTAIARIAGAAHVEHADSLEQLVIAWGSSTMKAELEAQRQRPDLSPEARQRVRHLLIRLVR